MKRAVSLLCSIAILFVLGAGAAGAARAAEPESALTLTFSEIEGLVTKGNPTIRNNEATIINLDNPYEIDEMIIALTLSYNSLHALAREARVILGQLMAAGGEGDPDPAPDPVREGLILVLRNDIAAYERDMAQIMAQLDQVYISPRPSFDKAAQQLGNANKLIVCGAESLFITCHALSRQLEQSGDNLKALSGTIKIMELRLSLGMISALSLAGPRAEYAQLELSIAGLENNLRSLHGQINLLLGRAHGAPLQIGELPSAARGFLKTVDRERDLRAAKNNNHLINIAKIDIDELSRQTGNNARRQEAIARNNLDGETREVELRYENMTKAIAGREVELVLAEGRLAQSKRVLEETAKRHKLGLVPKIALTQAESDVFRQEISVKAADAELFAAIRRYEWLVRGVNS